MQLPLIWFMQSNYNCPVFQYTQYVCYIVLIWKIRVDMRKATLKHLLFSFIVHISTHITETEAFFIPSPNTVTEIIKHLPDLNCIVISKHSMTWTTTRARTALCPGFPTHFHSESRPYPDFPWEMFYYAIKTVNQRREFPGTWATDRTIK